MNAPAANPSPARGALLRYRERTVWAAALIGIPAWIGTSPCCDGCIHSMPHSSRR